MTAIEQLFWRDSASTGQPNLKLNSLYMTSCNLSGPIPEGMLNRVWDLKLSHKNLSGSLPPLVPVAYKNGKV